MKQVTMAWAVKNIAKINLIDVRTPVEFDAKHIEGAKNIPLKKILKDGVSLFDEDKTYYLMCGSGGRSMVAYSKLESDGLSVFNCEGGISSILVKKI